MGSFAYEVNTAIGLATAEAQWDAHNELGSGMRSSPLCAKSRRSCPNSHGLIQASALIVYLVSEKPNATLKLLVLRTRLLDRYCERDP
jgi:hypothetical protein